MNKAYPSVTLFIIWTLLTLKQLDTPKKAVVFGSKGWGGGANKNGSKFN